MSGRSRHGLHLVRDAGAPAAEQFTACSRGQAETNGRLRPFLSMVTADGAPRADIRCDADERPRRGED